MIRPGGEVYITSVKSDRREVTVSREGNKRTSLDKELAPTRGRPRGIMYGDYECTYTAIPETLLLSRFRARMDTINCNTGPRNRVLAIVR